jgi:hypothetical protein
LLREATRDLAGEIEAHEGLARTMRKRDDEAAIGHYRAALTLAIGLGDKRKQGTLLNSMAILEWQRRKHAEALALYSSALQAFEKLDDPIHRGLVLNSIAVTLDFAHQVASGTTRSLTTCSTPS